MMALDRGAGRFLDLKTELRGEAHRPDHPDRIFAHAELGIANRADEPRLQIRDAADVIDDMERSRIVKQGVNREVAPKGIFFRGPERIVMADHRVAVVDYGFGLAAEGRHLDIVRAEEDVDQPEAPPDQARVTKQITHLLRMGRRGNVEVFGPARQHQVAYPAADQIRGVSRLNQPVQDFENIRMDVASRDWMLRALEDLRFQLLPAA